MMVLEIKMQFNFANGHHISPVKNKNKKKYVLVQSILILWPRKKNK